MVLVEPVGAAVQVQVGAEKAVVAPGPEVVQALVAAVGWHLAMVQLLPR